MAKEFKLEDPGEGLTEAEIVEIHVSEGDSVKDGDPLVSIETDKAVNEITVPFNGTIESIEVKEGDMIKVGETLVGYREEGEQEAPEDKQREETQQEPKEKEPKEEAQSEETTEEKKREQEPEPSSAKSETESTDDKGHLPSGPVPAAPATRKLARELGVDLHKVEPSGPSGRVTEEDVRAFAEKKPSREEPAPAAATAGQAPPLPDFSRWGEIERQPLRSVRRTIARQMSLSWSQVPHVMHQSVADVTALENYRQQYKKEVEEQGGKLTLTVFVLKATIAALKQFPRFNASLDTDNDEIILKRHYHLGMAVATDRGLMVPVIREADRKSVTELAVETATLADKARQGELKREEMQGGTFSLTNPGPIGATSFTPIIHYPEVAILGMCSTHLEPVVMGSLDNFEVAARQLLPLCLGYDHRVNDGADAARFLKTIVDYLQDPESFLLAV